MCPVSLGSLPLESMGRSYVSESLSDVTHGAEGSQRLGRISVSAVCGEGRQGQHSTHKAQGPEGHLRREGGT